MPSLHNPTMASTHLIENHQSSGPSGGGGGGEEGGGGGGGYQENISNHDFSQLLLTFPRERGWRTPHLYFYQNFWCQPKEIQSIINIQHHFKARDTDVILASIPKSGTTWLKALAFAIINRAKLAADDGAVKQPHPLLVSNPHDLIPFLEYKLYANNQVPDLQDVPEPRIFATHIPFASLPETVRESSNCKIVYICRNPFDTFVSSWHFIQNARPENLGPFSMEEAFDMYCNGVVGFGPFWEHMLGYWKQSLESTHKVMFLKYEDMKDDVVFHLKKLAEFLGYPFSVEEERGGVVEEISRLCSFGNMKELKVNKIGQSIANFENKSLFRKGEVGDWVNYLTPLMAEKLSHVMKEKLGGSGLSFKNLS